MHIPSLEDMVAQDDGGLSWCVAHPRFRPPRSRAVASPPTFRFPFITAHPTVATRGVREKSAKSEI
jgi:hypothetical protein